jgi:amino acid adenylation domain-containing protein
MPSDELLQFSNQNVSSDSQIAPLVSPPTTAMQLSRIQQQIWAAEQLAPGSPQANMGQLHRIDGTIDPHKFVQAVDRVVQVSDALRTVVHQVNGVPRVVVLSQPPQLTEIVALPSDEATAWAKQRIQTPLSVGSCTYDSVLLVHEGGAATWWLNIHHLVTDAWASALVFEAVASAYDDEFHPTQVGSFWEHRLLQEERSSGLRSQAASNYWKELVSPSQTPTWYRPWDPSFTKASTQSERLVVDQTSMSSFDQLIAGPFKLLTSEMSSAAALATVLAAFIHRIGGIDEVRIGMPVHHRRDALSRLVVGPCIEFFPLTVTVDKTDTFRSLHKRVSRSLVDMLRYAEPGTSPRQDAHAVLNVITASPSPFGSRVCQSEWIHSGHSDPNHPIRVQWSSFTKSGQQELALDVAHDIADSTDRLRVPQHFGALVKAMCGDPDTAIGSVDLRSDADAADQIAFHEAHSEVSIPTRSVISQIIQQLQQRGHETVIADEPDELGTQRAFSAAESLETIRAMARWLTANGIAAGDRVGIHMERSADAIHAIFGVLAAGASFVPIDPSYPPARVEHIRSDSGLTIMLEALPDLELFTQDAKSDNDWLCEVDLDREAYLLFTSGSTGLPKGVSISHRGLAEYMEFAASKYRTEGSPLVAGFISSLSFDLTITSLFLPFLTGGQIVVYQQNGLPALERFATDQQCNWLKATPSHLEILVRLLPASHPLRVIVVGGEAFSVELADRLTGALPGVQLHDEYGPTEAVVGCMIHTYRSAEDPRPPESFDVLIGRPAPRVSLRICDQYEQQVPHGAVGELWIARPGMATAYLNRPELSEEKFVRRNEVLWYRSGDLVRMAPNDHRHDLMYLGRVDTQLKVGGIRIEPAETERAVLSLPGVERVVVGMWKRPAAKRVADSVGCVRCGIPEDVPGVALDEAGLCHDCQVFDGVRSQAQGWFRDEPFLIDELALARSKRRGQHDAVFLLSGGKDSTYALYRLVALGFSVQALTLDNGFISDYAKENIARVVAHLGVDHQYVGPSRSDMNEIFRDSLERFSNVCNGCYKTIYTYGINVARSLGAPYVVTGLSRGQFFETRLVPGLFGDTGTTTTTTGVSIGAKPSAGGQQKANSLSAIDDATLAARKVYHRVEDACQKLLDTSAFSNDDIFDEVGFLDFYRYFDVSLEDLMAFLEQHTPWERPSDTGRSTNCLVNAAGIHVHNLERGFHNYAIPYAWDVRLGHKTRDQARHELDDPREEAAVQAMLDEIGYQPRVRETFTAWYELSDPSALDLDPDLLRSQLSPLLPAHAIPDAFVRVPTLPINANGKVDTARLPAPSARVDRTVVSYRAPSTDEERVLCDVWERVLGLERVGVDDDFFDLGGQSLDALEMVVRARSELNIEMAESAAFSCRTVSALAQLFQIAKRLPGEGVRDAPGWDAITPLDAGSLPPLSSGQQALLFEHLSRPGEGAYNVAHRYFVSGAIDIDRLRAAVEAVVARHEPLHFNFGSPRKQLDVSSALKWRSTSFTDDSALDDDVAFEEFCRNEATAPFDLINGPLVKFSVAQLPASSDGVQRFGVMTSIHHAAIDASSIRPFWQDVSDHYENGNLTNVGTTFGSFVAHQLDLPTEAAQAYFAEALGSQLSAPHLSSSPVNSADGYLTRTVDFNSARLRSVIPSAHFLAAAGAAVAQWFSEPDPVIGLTVSTRTHPMVNDLIGYFLNVVPIVVPVQSSDSVGETQARVEASIVSALDHRAYHYSRLVADRRHRNDDTPDLARVMFVFDDDHQPTLAGNVLQGGIVHNGAAVTDLTFFARRTHAGFEVSLEYSGRVLDEAGASLLLDLYAELCEQSAVRPQNRWSDLHHNVDVQGEQLSQPDQSLVLDDVRQSALANPTQVAVRCGKSQLTYEQLLHMGSAVATLLIGHGVQPGDGVVIGLERRVEFVAAIVGTWLAGAAYIPIDPDYPEGRIAQLLNSIHQSEMPVRCALVEGGDTLESALDERGIRSVRLNSFAYDHVEAGPTASSNLNSPDLDSSNLDLVPTLDGNDVAYVIFTSGSTGSPRGVAISHAQLSHSVQARSLFYKSEAPRFAMVSSFAFDSSVAGIFWTLCRGGELIVTSADQNADVDQLIDCLQTNKATHTLMVPSLFGAVIQRGHKQLRELEVAIVAGEACPSGLVKQVAELLPAIELVNEYGPTEATVWATAHWCQPDELTVAIGLPIAGVTLRVAHPDGVAVPQGALGELWISGPTLSNGYIMGADALAATRQRFVIDEAGRRWYRTGDVVRQRREGELEFVGRVDNQLSVGGIRIEAEEIEAVLGSMIGVSASLVRVEDGRLIAYVETGADPGPDFASVTTFLKSMLSRQIQPLVVAGVTLPRTANGKVDRTAVIVRPLPANNHLPRTVDTNSSLEQTGFTSKMLEIWSEVLGTDVHLQSDFFELGGDSLLAVELILRVEELAGTQVPISALITGRTPGALIQQVEESSNQILTCLRRGTPTGEHVLFFSAPPGDFLAYRELIDFLPASATVWGLELPGVVVGRGTLPSTVELLASQYVDLIEKHVPFGDLYLFGFSFGGLSAYATGDQLAKRGWPIQVVAMGDTVFPRHHSAARLAEYTHLVFSGQYRSIVKRALISIHEKARPDVKRARQKAEVDALTVTERSFKEFVFQIHDISENYDPPIAPEFQQLVLFLSTNVAIQKTKKPWSKRIPQLQVIQLSGLHDINFDLLKGDSGKMIADTFVRLFSEAHQK